MKDKDGQRRDDAAGRFLAAASSGARGSDLSAALSPLIPTLDAIISGVHARWNGRAPYPLDDLRQDTYERMLRTPPTRAVESHRPIATICAWVKNTAFNILRDRYSQDRRREMLAPSSATGESRDIESRDSRLARDSTERLRPDRQAEMSFELTRFSRILDIEDPTVARYLRLWMEHGFPTSREIALLMDTTPGYAEQLQHRLKVWVVWFNDVSRAEVA